MEYGRFNSPTEQETYSGQGISASREQIGAIVAPLSPIEPQSTHKSQLTLPVSGRDPMDNKYKDGRCWENALPTVKSELLWRISALDVVMQGGRPKHPCIVDSHVAGS
jgi:hypothetical protein